MNRTDLPRDIRENQELKAKVQPAMQIRLADESGKIYRWTIRRVPRAVNCTVGSSRVVAGWEYIDHEGYTRFSEGNWNDLLPHVRATAENYGLKFLSALS